jgi:hypothetical protein
MDLFTCLDLAIPKIHEWAFIESRGELRVSDAFEASDTLNYNDSNQNNEITTR